MTTTPSPTFTGSFRSLELSGNDALITYRDGAHIYMAVLDGDHFRPTARSATPQIRRALPGPQAYPAIVYSADNGGQPVSRAVIITYTADPTRAAPPPP